MVGKPGISSFDKFSIGAAIKSELLTNAGDLLKLNSSLMSLSNGDDDSRASLDPSLGARAVKKASSRRIGGTASSKFGGVGPKSTPARTANLLGNPVMRRYESPDANGNYKLGLDGSPAIGEYYDVYESESNHVRFMDVTAGKDLLGYTHLLDAAKERSGDEASDNVYLRSTYSVFSNLDFPFDQQDIERFRLGSKRYGPSAPYALKPLEDALVRRTLNGDIQAFQDNFEAVTGSREPYTGSLLDIWDFMGSHVYLNLLNGVMEHGLYNENYAFEPRNRTMIYDRGAVPQRDYPYFLNVDTVSPEKEIKGLLGKTNRMFYEGKIKSLVNRFATLNGENQGAPDFLNTATDHIYGLSRGRNLRKLDLSNENGYPNPYCRVWTTHYQYSKFKHLIRGPWREDKDGDGNNHYTLNSKDELMRPNDGYGRYTKMTALDSANGRPIFSPYYVNDRGVLETDSIKRCMFSIENLAWKDIIPDSVSIKKDGNEFEGSVSLFGPDSPISPISVTGGTARGFGMTLTKEQRGPNGGRIMWFPPYNLKFNEQLHADWVPHEFIGRGEKIYTYANSERTGSLSFTVLIDHPSIINEWARGGKLGKTANKTSPLSKDEVILRYFAGCDALEFNPRDSYGIPYSKVRADVHTITSKTITEEVAPEDKNKDMPKETQPEAAPTITFNSIFYYPNNYACEDYNNGSKASGEQRFKEALDVMFEKGKRSNGTYGYELGQSGATGSTGMTYEGSYYYKGPGKNGKTYEWYYPVDDRVNNEVLRNTNRYKDMQDFGLNGSKTGDGYSVFGNYWTDAEVSELNEGNIIEYLNNGNTGLTDSTNLTTAKTLVKCGVENKYLIPAYNFYKHLKDIVTLLNNKTKNGYKYKINIEGYASAHGYVSSNRTLAENRAAVIEGWIKSLGVFDFASGRDEITHSGNGQIADTATQTESDFKPKAARAAVVTLSLVPTKTVNTDTAEYAESPVKVEKTITGETTTTYEGEFYDTSSAGDYANQTYDDEYTYFKQLNENDDLVKRYISDKVDYFDPAFHSITPEGFNARLTFLQQCVRQGPTISASDLGGGGKYGAGNLSFGRAPYCILRIGDFFNTKICIQSINIEYDTGNGVQWDTNPEGAGMQPMMANINMTFTFVGGSDISGPISRLQNAVSYNYYANTSIYDRRADYRKGFIRPDDDTAMTWSPVILNKDKNRNVIEHIPFYTKKPDEGTNKGI